MRTLLRLVVVVMALSGLLAGTVVALTPAAEELPDAQSSVKQEVDLDALDEYAVRSYVYAADGGEIAKLHGPENREPVPLDEVPDEVKRSIVAVEDADFEFHGGVNLRATTRALLENVSEGGVVQGGSTITQQLVKNALLSADQTVDRKTTEAALALEVERRLTKDEILERYLNTVYFGAGAYGVEAAAETYWGRSVQELGWAEGALLAALIRYPNAYNPFIDPDAARRQRAIALDRMAQEGLITSDEARELGTAPLPASPCAPDAPPDLCQQTLSLPPPEDYFVEDVKQALLNDPSFGLGATPEERYESVFAGGIRVFTTLDPGAQFAAEAAVAKTVPENDEGVTAATVTIENETGAVRAMVGGPGFDQLEYNVATLEDGVQTGSTFKTFVLLAALEQGAVPSDTIEGGGTFVDPSDPEEKPYKMPGKGGSLEAITLASSNGAFVRLGQYIGMDDAFDVASRLGVTPPAQNPWAPYLAAPLGVFEQTPLEMASAYSAIPNGGLREPPYLIERIEDRDGNLVYEHKPQSTRPLSAQTACLAADILEQNVRSGTGTRARLDRQPAGGKTGTTGTSEGDDVTSDVWFIGFTPYVTTAVWMGDPTVDPVTNKKANLARFNGIRNFGGIYPARIWNEFNEAYHANLEVRSFPECERTRSGGRITEDGVPSSNRSSSSSSSSSSSRSSSGSSGRRSSPTTSPPTTSSPTTAAPSPSTTAAPAPPPTDAPPTTAPPTTAPPAPTTVAPATGP